MKKQHLSIVFMAVLMGSLLMFTQCSSKKDAMVGEERISMFCHGAEYRSSSDYFRASSVADSPNMANSKRMALSNARELLAGQLEVTVKSVIDNYFQDVTVGDLQEYQQRYEGMSREVINQQLTGTRVICEEVTRTPEGRYRTYIAIELSGSEIFNAMNERISRDDRLRLDYDYERFRNNFDQEMKNLERGRN
ncbi:MAG: hypothetical protein RG741_02870 [Bacteroidales bacterium]|nr:hypothetical protein [Bacteroidales bacterium]